MEDYSLNCKFTVEDLTLRAVKLNSDHKYNPKPNYGHAYSLAKFASKSINFEHVLFADGESPSCVLSHCLHVKQVGFKFWMFEIPRFDDIEIDKKVPVNVDTLNLREWVYKRKLYKPFRIYRYFWLETLLEKYQKTNLRKTLKDVKVLPGLTMEEKKFFEGMKKSQKYKFKVHASTLHNQESF